MENIVISTRPKIGAAVGINPQMVEHYVQYHGLPAWKIDGKGNWMALPEDLREWALEMRKKYYKPTP